jgi:acetyl esterase
VPLDPQAKALLDQMAAAGAPPLETMSATDARAGFAGMKELGGAMEPLRKTEDISIPVPDGQIPVRVYTPEGNAPMPGVVYFHGGGWVIGSPETLDAPCSMIANAANCVVVSVDYRLAPEFKFPTAAEDCYAATRWVAENARQLGIDPSRLAVAGDSAGGNLSAVVALMARDRGGPALVYQALVYPVTDFNFDTPSYTENAEALLLTKAAMVWFWNHYLRSPEDGQNPYASPLRASDLSNLPPAFVVTAEYDPLRDEGRAYAERLRQAGVTVEAKNYDGMIHGFFQMPAVLAQGRQAVLDVAARLKEAFTRSTSAAHG